MILHLHNNYFNPRAELDAELTKGMDSLKAGSYTADEVDAALAKEFEISNTDTGLRASKQK